jgi:release factor glutamine methyltransferase
MPGTLHERLARARQALINAGLSPRDAALDAEVLARYVLGWDRAKLLAHGHERPPGAFDARFDAAIARRAAREPVAYITGAREFWGRDFVVTPDVLVPRPETEIIVEVVLARCPPGRRARILDVGTGSGCLAVSLAAELPSARVVATDTSLSALGVARTNARRHSVEARVSFVCADLLACFGQPFDVIVSNPPYVPSGDSLPADVARYEPRAALFAGSDGLDALRRLIPAARPLLAGDGLFVVEFGFGQADAVRALAEAAGWPRVEVRHDLQGIPRTCVMTLAEG